MEATRIIDALSVSDWLVLSAKLFKNVQFIYELYLAELELKALGVKFEISKGYRNFKIFNGKEDIKNRSAYFEEVNGEHTHYFMITQKNRTNSVNQYLTHWFYPYKGKFHPQMIMALINTIGVRDGQIVLDPFSGSGTTALECMLLGVDFIGYDVSPLCVIIGRVKTESVHALSEIEGLKNDVLRYYITLKGEEYYSFLDKLTNNEIVKNFYKLVRLIAISDLSRRKKDYKSSFVKNLYLMLLSVKDMKEIKESLNLSFGKISIEQGDARNLKLPDNSVDGIITSPPYSIALDYVQNDIHALKDLGYSHREIREWFIGVRGNGKERIELYNEDMKKAYKEMHRVLKANRYAVIVIGNAKYQGKEIDTVDFTIDYMEGLGFKLEENIDKIIFGLYNVMKDENVLIFKKMMDKEAYIKTLEDIIDNFIKPLKHIPFNIVIKAISGKDVLKFDENNPEHKEVLKVLIQVAEEAGRRINEQGIMRTRANEVGNDIERYVLKTFKRLEIYAQRPKGKSAGYPDIEFEFNGRIYYLECKTFNLENLDSTFRTFYFSPSEDFKVEHETYTFHAFL